MIRKTDLTREEQKKAVAILNGILTESFMESDYDVEIYNFLKEIGELPPDYSPYWMRELEEQEEEEE